MINADMRSYDYYLYETANSYGQAQLSKEIKGSVKMAINISSQSIQDNINYKDCQYIGLTHANIDDTYVILYGAEKLKVKYINPKGKFKQVFLSKI